MWKTVLLLIITLVLAPFLAFRYDVPLTDFQKQILWLLLVVYFTNAMLCFIVSSITDNYSQVDKLWSIIPIAYSWIVAWKGEFETRIVVMAILVTVWGVRLSYNFARRGGYRWMFWQGEEDYRWAILREKPEFKPRWKWVAFNLFFISFYQMGLILLFTLPILKSLEGKPWGLIDVILTISFLLLVTVQTIADQQQWNFHKEKNRRKEDGSDLENEYSKGFVHTGLWSMVRHPNYAAEQGIWIVFYLFSVAATGNWINWSIMGCLLLLLLFKGSSDFSESISATKYPEYGEYQKKVPRFIPFINYLRLK